MSTEKNFVILLCLIILSSCASVNIKDGEFCGDLGSDGAECFTTLSGQSRTISPGDWDDERFGMICSKADTFANWKKAILKLCKLSKRCKYDVKKKIIEFGDNVESYQVKINDYM